MRLRRQDHPDEHSPEHLSQSRPYLIFLLYIAIVPLITLWYSLEAIQLMYAVLGAFFMPFLALTLLLMNNRKEWVGERFTNGLVSNTVLVITLIFFSYAWIQQVVKAVSKY